MVVLCTGSIYLTVVVGSAEARWKHPSIVRALLCIHRYEGSWTDPYAPYWGGLQMDRSFMRAYGPRAYRRWGTADHWPWRVQVRAGVKAVLVRGYSPWPRTRYFCGV